MLPRVWWLGIAWVSALTGQVIVPEFDFRPPAGGEALHCQVTPVRPELDYSLRLRAGYQIRIPMGQYRGPAHRWRVWLSLTPNPGNASVYLADTLTLPPVPQTNLYGEFSGSFLVGDGHYLAALLLADDLGRVCRHQWQFDARWKSPPRS